MDQTTADGLSALQRGQLHDAELMLRTALNQNAANAQALHGLGIIGHRTGHFEPALSLYDQALAIDPAFAAAYVNRGNLLTQLQRFNEAIQSHQTAIQLAPQLVSARINLASALQAVGRIDEAVASLEAAREIDPDSPALHNNLGNLYKEQGRLADAIGAYSTALSKDARMVEAASNRLAAWKLDSTMSPSTLLEKHRTWSGFFEGVMSMAPLQVNVRDAERKLRIGYVSPDCHTALPAFIDHVLMAHDRARFEVYCYFNNPQTPESLQRRGIAATSRGIRGAPHEDVAKLIQSDAIDILIDIAGHTGHNQLLTFARRAAPVQVTWLDYLGTTGLLNMDYRITDAVADPPGAEAFHTEQLLRMPHTQWSWQPDAAAPVVAPLPALRNGYVTFGSFNNAIKLTDATLALWRTLLDALPASRLVIAGIAEGVARERILAQLNTDTARISFLPRVSVNAYRESFSQVDIALDPMPFSGATTTLDALWQGVPVLTLPGATSCSRSSASILTALGLTDWVATDHADWLARALRLSADTETLIALRAGLRARVSTSPLTDVHAFTAALETHYRAIWRTWCEQRAVAEQNVAQGEIRTLADCDAALQHARRELAAVARADGTLHQPPLDHATATLARVLRLRPSWELAKKDFAQSLLAWSRLHPEARTARQLLLPQPVPRTKVSVIICSIRPDYFAHIAARMQAVFSQHDIEVIGIHDARSLCEGYNRGAAKARGDILIFCHDDIELVHDDFAARLLSHLQRYDVIGVAGTSLLVNSHWGQSGSPYAHGQIIHRPTNELAMDHARMSGFVYLAAGLQQPVMEGIQALDGVFIATHRHVWDKLRFDQETFDGFHVYDVDFTYRAHLAGYRIAIPLDLLLIHFSTGSYSLAWDKYNVRFLEKFPQLPNVPNVEWFSSCNVKSQTLEQVERLQAGFLYHQFGTLDPSRNVPHH